MQEIVPLIISGGDPASVETLPNWERVPWLEVKQTLTYNVEQRPSPRTFATHMPYNMMPPSFFKVKPKVNLSLLCVMFHLVTQGSMKVQITVIRLEQTETLRV